MLTVLLRNVVVRDDHLQQYRIRLSNTIFFDIECDIKASDVTFNIYGKFDKTASDDVAK